MLRYWILLSITLIVAANFGNTTEENPCLRCSFPDCARCFYSRDCQQVVICSYNSCVTSLNCPSAEIFDPDDEKCVNKTPNSRKCQNSTAYFKCSNPNQSRHCPAVESARLIITILTTASPTPSPIDSSLDFLTIQLDRNAASNVAPSPDNLIEGNTYTFVCRLCPTGRYVVEKILWSLNGQILRNTTRSQIVGRREMLGCTTEYLILNHISWRDSGLLNCSVEYNYNFCYNVSLKIDVRKLPRVHIDTLSITAYKNSSLRWPVSCIGFVSLDDIINSSLTIRWYSSRSLLVDNDKYIVNKSSAWVHEVTELLDSDYFRNKEIITPFASTYKLDGSTSMNLYCSVDLEGVGVVQSKNCSAIFIDKNYTNLCPEEQKFNILWMKTLAHSTDWKPCCRGMSGFASRLCRANATWSDVDIQTCTSNSIQNIHYMINASMYQATDTNQTTLDNYLSELLDALNSSFKTQLDLITVANDLYMLSIMRRTNPTITLPDMMTVANIVTKTTTADQWPSIKSTTPPLQLLQSINFYMEVCAIDSNYTGNKNDLHIYRKDTIEIRRLIFLNNSQTESVATLSYGKKQIIFPRITINQISSILHSEVIFGYVASMSNLDNQMNNLPSIKIISSIVSVSILNWRSDVKFDAPVEIVIDHLISVNDTEQAECAYWRDNGTLTGAWAFDGCEVKVSTSNSSSTTCLCNHLTNFAILLSPKRIDGNHYTILSIISLIGCVISIGALLFTILIYWLQWRTIRKQKEKKRTIVIINLCFALIIANSLFIGGVNRTEYAVACLVVAVLLHYFYLCVFFLMLVLGVIHYRAVYEPLDPLQNYLLKGLLVFAWLTPALVVAISLALTRSVGYGGPDNCWLSIDTGLLWAFVGPALAVIFVNFVFMVAILSRIYCCKKNEIRNTREKTKPCTVLTSIIVLNMLFGVTWIFGVLSINSSLVVFQYIFTCVNSFQGLWIFTTEIIIKLLIKKNKNSNRAKGINTDGSKSQATQKEVPSLPKVGKPISNEIKNADDDMLQYEYSDLGGIEEITLDNSRGVINKNSIDSSTIVSTSSCESYINEAFNKDD